MSESDDLAQSRLRHWWWDVVHWALSYLLATAPLMLARKDALKVFHSWGGNPTRGDLCPLIQRPFGLWTEVFVGLVPPDPPGSGPPPTSTELHPISGHEDPGPLSLLRRLHARSLDAS